MPSNFDPTNTPRRFDLAIDSDVQARRIHTIGVGIARIMDDTRRLDDEVNPVNISSGESAGYQTQITALRTALVAAQAAVIAIDALLA